MGDAQSMPLNENDQVPPEPPFIEGQPFMRQGEAVAITVNTYQIPSRSLDRFRAYGNDQVLEVSKTQQIVKKINFPNKPYLLRKLNFSKFTPDECKFNKLSEIITVQNLCKTDGGFSFILYEEVFECNKNAYLLSQYCTGKSFGSLIF